VARSASLEASRSQGYFKNTVAPRRSGFFVTVIPEKLASRELDASVEASGPHDFSVRKLNALVSRAARVHRIPPRVCDDGQRPSVGRDGGDMQVIWVFGKPEYFFRWDWTGRNSLIRLEKLDFTRKSVGR
jgi:hypothetical protein